MKKTHFFTILTTILAGSRFCTHGKMLYLLRTEEFFSTSSTISLNRINYTSQRDSYIILSPESHRRDVVRNFKGDNQYNLNEYDFLKFKANRTHFSFSISGIYDIWYFSNDSSVKVPSITTDFQWGYISNDMLFKMGFINFEILLVVIYVMISLFALYKHSILLLFICDFVLFILLCYQNYLFAEYNSNTSVNLFYAEVLRGFLLQLTSVSFLTDGKTTFAVIMSVFFTLLLFCNPLKNMLHLFFYIPSLVVLRTISVKRFLKMILGRSSVLRDPVSVKKFIDMSKSLYYTICASDFAFMASSIVLFFYYTFYEYTYFLSKTNWYTLNTVLQHLSLILFHIRAIKDNDYILSLKMLK